MQSGRLELGFHSFRVMVHVRNIAAGSDIHGRGRNPLAPHHITQPAHGMHGVRGLDDCGSVRAQDPRYLGKHRVRVGQVVHHPDHHDQIHAGVRKSQFAGDHQAGVDARMAREKALGQVQLLNA